VIVSNVPALDVFRMLADIKRAGMSTRAVAKRLGMSSAQLHRCKVGDAELTFSQGTALANLHAAIANVPRAEQNV
jgi:transposase-like protein